MREWLKLLLYSICIITLLLHLLPDGKVRKVCPLLCRPAFLSHRHSSRSSRLSLGNGELTKLLQLRFLKEENP